MRVRSISANGSVWRVSFAAPPREFGHAANLWDGKLLAEHLKRRHGVRLGVRQCQRLFGQLGFRLRNPRPQVAQADPLKVAAVKKLRRLAKRRDVELWNLDECHFQQHGTRTRMWVAPEIRDPVLLHAPTRKSMACFGAVSLSSGRFVRMLAPKFNPVSFELFLKRLLRHRSRACRMVVVLDNAPDHHAAAAVTQVPPRHGTAVPTHVQPAARPDRAVVETRPSLGNAQPILPDPRRAHRRGQRMLRSMEQTELDAAQTMRHYLRRSV